MKVLVTGGAGFIGSHIVDGALQFGDEVCVLDDLSTGQRKYVPAAAKLVVGDIRNAKFVEDVFSEFRPEVVCHQAAQVSVPRSFEDPANDLDVNALGTVRVLEAARRCQSRFVFGSSGGAIYGEVAHGQKASLETVPAPITPYGCSKLAAELYIQSYAAHYGMKATILRYSNVFGPRQSASGEGGVVAIFVERLARNEKIKVYGCQSATDAGCVRDYIFVGDVVQANLKAMRDQLDHNVINVSTGVATATRELAHLLVDLRGGHGKIEYEDPRAGDVERSVLAPTYQPDSLVSLRDGLKITISWQENQQDKLWDQKSS